MENRLKLRPILIREKDKPVISNIDGPNTLKKVIATNARRIAMLAEKKKDGKLLSKAERDEIRKFILNDMKVNKDKYYNTTRILKSKIIKDKVETIIVSSTRGTGKTFSTLEFLYKEATKVKNRKKFVILRNTEVELKAMKSGLYHLMGKYNLEIRGFDVYDKRIASNKTKSEKIVGSLQSLNNSSKLAGLDFGIITYVFYDEFMERSSGFSLTGQAGLFFSGVEPILRQIPGAKVFLASNFTEVDNSLIQAFGFDMMSTEIVQINVLGDTWIRVPEKTYKLNEYAGYAATRAALSDTAWEKEYGTDFPYKNLNNLLPINNKDFLKVMYAPMFIIKTVIMGVVDYILISERSISLKFRGWNNGTSHIMTESLTQKQAKKYYDYEKVPVMARNEMVYTAEWEDYVLPPVQGYFDMLLPFWFNNRFLNSNTHLKKVFGEWITVWRQDIINGSRS